MFKIILHLYFILYVKENLFILKHISNDTRTYLVKANVQINEPLRSGNNDDSILFEKTAGCYITPCLTFHYYILHVIIILC